MTLDGGRRMASLSPFFATVTLSRGATATTANSAPLGFQHLVQPQAWLCADWDLTVTSTGFWLHLQTSVPPAKSLAAAFEPLSTAGWIETVAMCVTLADVLGPQL
jgi:hypothetical protein